MSRRNTSVYFDPVDHEVLRRLSKETRVPFSEYLRVWIKLGLYGPGSGDGSAVWDSVDKDLQRQRRGWRDEILDRWQASDVEENESGAGQAGDDPLDY